MSSKRVFDRFCQEFAVVQFPIADLRPLAAESTGRLARPSWPDPIAGQEFMRTVGSIRDRPRGPIADWSGERAFCDATGLVRFPAPLVRRAARPAVISPGMTHDPWSEYTVIPRYRRMYGSGTSVRVDVAMTLRWWYLAWENSYSSDLDALTVPVTLPWQDADPVPLAAIGSLLARRLAEVSTRHGHEPRYNLVEAGTPMLMVERHADKGFGRLAEERDGVRFDCHPVIYRGHRIPVWSLTFLPHCAGDRGRQIRGNLWRMHAERESLRSALRAWGRDRKVYDGHQLRDYLHGQLRVLNRTRVSGVEQEPLLRIAQQIESLAPPDLIDDLRRQLRQQSLGVLRSLDRLVERTIGYDYATPVRPSLRIYVRRGGQVIMNAGDNYTVRGDAAGSAFGPGSHVHNRDVHVLPTAELGELANQVSRLAGELPASQRAELGPCPSGTGTGRRQDPGESWSASRSRGAADARCGSRRHGRCPGARSHHGPAQGTRDGMTSPSRFMI